MKTKRVSNRLSNEDVRVSSNQKKSQLQSSVYEAYIRA